MRTQVHMYTCAASCAGIHIYIIHTNIGQRCQPPPSNGHGSDKYPPPVVVVLWLGCGGLGLVQNWFRVYLGCIWG